MNKQVNRARRKRSAEEDEPIIEMSLEALDEATERINREQDAEGLIATKYTDGSTSNPADAEEQGLVYTPPSDPPVLASDNSQGAEIAAGFAPSMEESNPDVEVLPARVDNNDLDLEDDIVTVLRYNSETANLDDVSVRVRDGIAYLRGNVYSNEDLAIVQGIIEDLDGVVDVVNELQVADYA